MFCLYWKFNDTDRENLDVIDRDKNYIDTHR